MSARSGICAFRRIPSASRIAAPVAQSELKHFYAAADLFVLASRQDGFGMVLSQALASGLPVVCTDRTGGGDLAALPGFAARITVVPSGDADALAETMRLLAGSAARRRRAPAARRRRSGRC